MLNGSYASPSSSFFSFDEDDVDFERRACAYESFGSCSVEDEVETVVVVAAMVEGGFGNVDIKE